MTWPLVEALTPLQFVIADAKARQAAEAALQEQQDNEARERAALRTILDSKMRNLLGDLARGLAELPPGVRPSLLCAEHGVAKARQVSWKSRGLACLLASGVSCGQTESWHVEKDW